MENAANEDNKVLLNNLDRFPLTSRNDSYGAVVRLNHSASKTLMMP